MGNLLIKTLYYKIFIDLKNILIVLHGDFKINNERNLSGGHHYNASNVNSNNGVEEKTIDQSSS